MTDRHRSRPAPESSDSSKKPSKKSPPKILSLDFGPVDNSSLPFPRRIIARDDRLLTDEILPPGVLLEFVPADILNAFINAVELRAVITERDPDEDDRYLTISNRFYTHFHEFGTVIHVVAESSEHWWYFCYDIDARDCVIGRTEKEEMPLEQVIDWVRERRLSDRYPTLDIDVADLHGWRSFQ